MSQFGIEMVPIPRGEEKTPDFEFTCESDHYVVEIKDRVAQWALSEEEIKAFQSGEIVHKSEGLGHKQSFASRIVDGTRQIEAYNPSKDSFRLIWYFAYGGRASVAAKRIVATLVGDAWAIDMQTGKQWTAYFFRDNLFSALKDKLDGALILQETENDTFIAQFLINPHSSRYEKLRLTRFASLFPEGLIDPLAMEALDEALIVPEGIDRTSEQAITSALGFKYGINPPVIMPQGHMVAICSTDPTHYGEGYSEEAEPG